MNLRTNMKTNILHKFGEPPKFNILFNGINIKCVQVHSLNPIEIDGIKIPTGFCGSFKWEDNKIIPLDGDSYSEDMLVNAYDTFKMTNGTLGVNIYTYDW